MKDYALKVNGHTRQVKADPDTPLLYILRYGRTIALGPVRSGSHQSSCRQYVKPAVGGMPEMPQPTWRM